MYAEIVVNIEAPLEGTFHYFVPADLQKQLKLGHLVEIEFGRRLAQGIIIAFSQASPVDDVKPVIALIDEQPVVLAPQIKLAQWMSTAYLTPLNACLRLMLPPGITRWSDITLAIHPRHRSDWETLRLTDKQRAILTILTDKGDQRGRQLDRQLGGKKSGWRTAANQLIKREILLRGTLLDPPRVRPKQVKTATLIGSPTQLRGAVRQLGRSSKKADLLLHLLESDDPLPVRDDVLAATGASETHLSALIHEEMVQINPQASLLLPSVRDIVPEDEELQAALMTLPQPAGSLPQTQQEALINGGFATLLQQPATIALTLTSEEALNAAFQLRSAQRYHHILHLLSVAAQPVSVSQLYTDTGATITHLRKLVALDLIRLGSEEVWRDPLADKDFVPAEAPQLTIDQARMWGRVKIGMLTAEPAGADGTGGPTPYLLHGVTGSGKTEIYMRAIQSALDNGQRAVVLVPEIALTPQTVRRFAARFPGHVAVLHSRLTDGERYDTWRRARQGMIDILIGPRSALFAPLPDLAVIVLDEEHDPSYKQTPPVPPPYYHTRAVAAAYGRINGSVVILGSATPDIVTYHAAQAGRLNLLELPKRVMGHRARVESQAERLHVDSQYEPLDEALDDAMTIPLPPIQVVDLRQELRAGNRSIFSRALQDAMDETIERGEQAILFLNRRGTSTFIICRDCGHVLRCPRCDTPLTYHRPRMMLTCHQCNHREQPHSNCPACGSRRIKYFGLGTEELETLVNQRWPDARIVRWDRDTTAGRDKHETLLASFINQEADVLVGTQMIAKGLDLPLVTLVGVISADVSLGLPDYRTGERAFQLLAQVAGRAGRGLLGGRVIIQTYQPQHYAVQAAADHDYKQFYVEEIRFRTKQRLPPFRRLARLVIADPIQDRGQREAEQLARRLRLEVREKELGATEIIGPVPPFFSRVDGRYRWQILVRSPDPVRLLDGFQVPPRWIVDIDPVSTL